MSRQRPNSWTMRRGAASSAFPDPNRAPKDGPLALGGDLSPARLLDAYSHGIFPWFENDELPILWWSPDPRAVLAPAELRVSRSLAKQLRSGRYDVTADRAFADVVAGCAVPRQVGAGTWITQRMRRAYCELHRAGYAHSVEAWRDDALVGGLYGVSLGGMFFGESMFSRAADASKVALAHLARQLAAWNFTLIDCQMPTDHLRSLGAREMPRAKFLHLVAANNDAPTRRGLWAFERPAKGDWRQRGASG